jgi:hypothetical protein
MTIAVAVRRIAATSVFLVASYTNAQPVTRPPSPVLLKRLAEAVDGNRTGVPVYVVASHDSLSPVRGVFATRAEGDRQARLLGSSYEVFGPFMAPLDAAAPYYLMGCIHDGLFSMMGVYCPDPNKVLPKDSVVGLTIVARMRDGTTRNFPLSTTADAVFLTLPAIDKFVVPYYAHTIGVDSAAAMRARIRSAIVRRP